MSAAIRPDTPDAPALSVDYVSGEDPAALLTDDTLALFGFGETASHCDDPRYLRVPLQPYTANRASSAGGPRLRSAPASTATCAGPAMAG